MSDCMTFPDTVEEFIEQYKVVDTDHVYSNGVEFIPIFRMKQWFEHLPSAQPDIIRCKDCIYHGQSKYDQAENTYCYYHMMGGMHDDDFCSYGERRTDGEIIPE